MGRYLDKTLLKNETVVFETAIHRIVYLVPACLIAFGLVTLAVTPMPAALVLIVGGISLLGRFIRRNTSEFVVTNRRVVIKVGFIARRTIELALTKVESVDVRQSISGRMLGYGRIVVVGTGGSKAPFTMIAKPIDFRRAVENGQS